MAFLFAVLSGYALALVAPPVARRQPRAAGWVLAVPPLLLFGYFLSYVPLVAGGGTAREVVPWVPSLGIDLSFSLDGLSLLFALLILGIGALVVIYAGGYLAGHRRFSRFFAYFFLFQASMLGVVLADNVIALFVFWELTSVSSYLLIGFERERETARRAALQALLVTGMGGLALLAGLLLLGRMGGSLELTEIVQAAGMQSHELHLPALLLILLGAFTKSAQFPFHFWLPNAMEAPTPVSAYLHSATMVKAGIYLMARLNPALGGTEAWQMILMTAGGATMLVGAYLALAQTDLKRVLAYSTVSSLGALTFLLGVGSEAAMTGAMAFLLAHALYKGSLFLVTGAIDHEAGTRDVRMLGGLRGAMPVTMGAAILAACSMAGVPFFWGFIGKETFYGAVLGWEGLAPAAAGLLAGIAFVAVAGAMVVLPFFGASKAAPKHAHEAPVSLWLGPMCLGATDLLLGLMLGSSVEEFLTSAAQAIAGPAAGSLGMELWHLPGTALLLSGISWALGAAMVWKASAVRGVFARGADMLRWGPSEAYELALAGMNGFARLQTRILQSGLLRYYFMTIVGTVAVLTGYALTAGGGFVRPVGRSTIQFHEAAVAVLILAAAIVAARATSRLAAITALGVVGYGVALIYVLYGAPDLAMTQFMVETLTVILLLLVFYHLPSMSRLRTPAGRLRDLAASLAGGAVITALVLTATAQERFGPLTAYFAANSYTEGHGRNIVNVILVDFRGLDTMGEITVLGVAGVGIYALLKLRLPGRSDDGGKQ